MQINELPTIPQAPADADVLAIEVNGITYKVSKSALVSSITPANIGLGNAAMNFRAQNVGVSLVRDDFTLRANVSNANNPLNGHDMSLAVQNDALTLYDHTDNSQVWKAQMTSTAGTVTASTGTVNIGQIRRYGNVCMLCLRMTLDSAVAGNSGNLCTLPSDYCPSTDINIAGWGTYNGNEQPIMLRITTGGTVQTAQGSMTVTGIVIANASYII